MSFVLHHLFAYTLYAILPLFISKSLTISNCSVILITFLKGKFGSVAQ